jgi:TATA-box binding protein (TBP) (component of TFIID and TFIIIB)
LFPSVSTSLSTGCTLSIFKTGNLMATGAKSQYRAMVSALILCHRLNRMLPEKCARVVAVHVVNLVAAVSLGFDLDIEHLHRDMQFSGLFVKSSFQGLSINMHDLGCVFVVFARGCKVNIAGMFSASAVDAVAHRLMMFHRYKVDCGKDLCDDDDDEIPHADDEMLSVFSDSSSDDDDDNDES